MVNDLDYKDYMDDPRTGNIWSSVALGSFIYNLYIESFI